MWSGCIKWVEIFLFLYLGFEIFERLIKSVVVILIFIKVRGLRLID